MTVIITISLAMNLKLFMMCVQCRRMDELDVDIKSNYEW